MCSIFIKCLEYLNAPYEIYKKVCTALFSVNISQLTEDSILSIYAEVSQLIFADFIEYDSKLVDIIKQVKEYVNNNLSGDLSLNTISSMVYHSPTYFSRISKKVTGYGFSEYVINLRLKKAKELLEGTSLKVGEIAAKVGYDSIPYFIKSFKKAYGKTPNEYRIVSSKSNNEHT